tara:strand:- start:1538 stop:2422 length:885 start_codon:yes stop_codon:yes gene_type:complete
MVDEKKENNVTVKATQKNKSINDEKSERNSDSIVQPLETNKAEDKEEKKYEKKNPSVSETIKDNSLKGDNVPGSISDNADSEKIQTKKLIGKKLDSKNENSPNKSANRKTPDQSVQDKSSEGNELVEKLVSINRVAKVVKGGRRFSFAALVVVGDGNGLVGHGKGKAKEVPEAIKKATDEAKNQMIRVPLRQGRTLHHDIKGRYDSGKVYLRSAPSGTGVIAGGPMRAVFEALGIQDIVAKSVGTSNPHNMVRATFEALKNVSSPKIIAMRRGLKINEITKRRKSDKEVSDVKN